MKDNIQIIIAEMIETVQNGNDAAEHRVFNPTLILTAPIIPSALSFSICVNFYDIKIPQNTEILIKIKDPEGSELFHEKHGDIPELDEQNNTRVVVNLRNMLFKVEGQHTVYFIINGKEYTQEFRVKNLKIME